MSNGGYLRNKFSSSFSLSCDDSLVPAFVAAGIGVFDVAKYKIKISRDHVIEYRYHKMSRDHLQNNDIIRFHVVML